MSAYIHTKYLSDTSSLHDDNDTIFNFLEYTPEVKDPEVGSIIHPNTSVNTLIRDCINKGILIEYSVYQKDKCDGSLTEEDTCTTCKYIYYNLNSLTNVYSIDNQSIKYVFGVDADSSLNYTVYDILQVIFLKGKIIEMGAIQCNTSTLLIIKNHDMFRFESTMDTNIKVDSTGFEYSGVYGCKFTSLYENESVCIAVQYN